jgi:hypothetical protein
VRRPSHVLASTQQEGYRFGRDALSCKQPGVPWKDGADCSIWQRDFIKLMDDWFVRNNN